MSNNPKKKPRPRGKVTESIARTLRNAATGGATLVEMVALVKQRHRVTLVPSTISRHLQRAATWALPAAPAVPAPEADDVDDADDWDQFTAELLYVDAGALLADALDALTAAERLRLPRPLLSAIEALVVALNNTVPPEEREVPSCAG